MYYQAKANVISDDVDVRKGQRISKELYDRLPDRQKKKFKARKQPINENAAAFNNIIGDTPEEQKKRESLKKEDDQAAAKKKALAEMKSKAENYIRQVKGRVSVLGEKVSEENRTKLDAEIEATKIAVGTDDIEKIKAAAYKLQVLFENIQKQATPKKDSEAGEQKKESPKESGAKQPPVRQK